MSCLNIRITKYNSKVFSFSSDRLKNIDVKIDNIILKLPIQITTNSRLEAFIDKKYDNLKVSVNKICLDNFELPVVTYTRKKPIQISFGLVCSTEELVYMNVSPETVQWLTPDMGIIYEVTSNVNWQIDY